MQWVIDNGERPWHRWFAWYPVDLDGTPRRAWLEWVERRTTVACGWRIHYHRSLR